MPALPYLIAQIQQLFTNNYAIPVRSRLRPLLTNLLAQLSSVRSSQIGPDQIKTILFPPNHNSLSNNEVLLESPFSVGSHQMRSQCNSSSNSNQDLDHHHQAISKLNSLFDDFMIAISISAEDIHHKETQWAMTFEQLKKKNDFHWAHFISILLDIKKIAAEILQLCPIESQNIQNCSYNTEPNPHQTSNSGSVRSLLTQKIKQAALEDQDPQQMPRGSKIIKGMIIRPIREPQIKRTRNAALKLQDLLVHSANALNMSDPCLKNAIGDDSRARVLSSKTILGQMDVNIIGVRQRYAPKGVGCARCEIY